MTKTSGGVPLSRARLTKVLDGLPVHPTYTERARPFAWGVEHALDRVRAFHPYNRMADAEVETLRAPGIEQAAAALTTAGYNVTLRHIPDDAMLAELPTALREQMADTVPILQVMIVPD